MFIYIQNEIELFIQGFDFIVFVDRLQKRETVLIPLYSIRLYQRLVKPEKSQLEQNQSRQCRVSGTVPNRFVMLGVIFHVIKRWTQWNRMARNAEHYKNDKNVKKTCRFVEGKKTRSYEISGVVCLTHPT